MPTSSPKRDTKDYDYLNKGLLDLNEYDLYSSKAAVADKTHAPPNDVTLDLEESCPSSSNANSDDFTDLVNVLTRQDQDFKKKFFDCLMPKLWDTKLPYSEYMQLNKLMTALFGESYHKMDPVSQPVSMSRASSHRPDAGHIVGLMKAYLESTSTALSPLPTPVSDGSDFNNYPSVNNLINTLKRRKNHETLVTKKRNEEATNFINGLANKASMYFNPPQLNNISPIVKQAKAGDDCSLTAAPTVKTYDKYQAIETLVYEKLSLNSEDTKSDGIQTLPYVDAADVASSVTRSQIVTANYSDKCGDFVRNEFARKTYDNVSAIKSVNMNSMPHTSLKNKSHQLLKLQNKNSNLKVYSNQMSNMVKQIIHLDEQQQQTQKHANVNAATLG